MSLLSRLFGGGGSAPKEPEAIDYNGFRIFPSPVKEAQGYRISARIEKEVNGSVKTHEMIRADTIGDQTQAIEATVSKAKQVIDQMGERIFQ